MRRSKLEIPLIDANEQDAFTRWRHLLCVFRNNTGLVKYWQRRYNKRVRRRARETLQKLNPDL